MAPHSRLGLHLSSDGPARACVFAAHADAIDVCLLDPAGGQVVASHPLTRQADGLWSGEVPGAHEGDAYLLRVDGPWDPAKGMRHNPAKLVLDPYARTVAGTIDWGQSVFGHRVDETWRSAGDVRDETPNVGRTPYGLLAPARTADPATRPRTPLSDTVVYETHLRGLTMRHPDVPQELRGTWAGLAHPAVVEHLTTLGVTAVELLPVFAVGDEVHLARRGASNYWGYNTLNFFAPEPRYVSAAARAAGPGAVLAEVAGAVDTLHAAGLEVWLDVVYNHTCEGGVDGPTFSWRGIDAASYYRLDADGRDIDMTGCGNTLDFAHPRVVQLALDSLRYWTTTFGIDGYRFDLAPALGRGADGGYSPDHPFLVAARTDPTLADVKLVAEPWDLGPDGWRTGQFPPPFGEWNDRFRDAARTFWVSDAAARRQGGGGHGVADLATRLAGSSDLFGTAASYDRVERANQASVNFVTAHDGFTLADLVAYDQRHNEPNGENNRDGTSDNRSWNHGVEGPTDDPEISAARDRTARGLLATLLLSAGTPMLLGGDELGRTQRGNNNAYCLDDDTAWTDWEHVEESRLEFVRRLLALRATHPVLRQTRRFAGRGEAPGIDWFTADGVPMTDGAWNDPGTCVLQMLVRGPDAGALLLVLSAAAADEVDVTLPDAGGAASYRLVLASAGPDDAAGVPGQRLRLPGSGVAVFEVAG